MINHARTLLMNTRATRANYADSGYEGYEYIPDNFVPTRLSAGLASIYRLLFGEHPDGLFKGLRVRELLSYIHETELESYLYKFDARVTYWPEQINTKDLFDRKRILVTQTRGEPRRLFISGDLFTGENTGVSYRSYIVALGKISGTQNLGIYAKHLEPLHEEVIAPFNPPDSMSVQLPQSRLAARVSESAFTGVSETLRTEIGGNIIAEDFRQIGPGNLLLETPTNFNVNALQDIIAQWYVITRVAPPPAITSLLPALEKIGEVSFIELFGLKNEEPYSTFKTLWEDHPLATYRLAGVTLALIYRLEELRVKNVIV